MSTPADSYLQPPQGEGWQPVEIPPPLPTVGILTGLSEKSLANLSEFGRYEKHSRGQTMIYEGAEQDRFYVLITGKLEIFLESSGSPIHLNWADPGECLGEVSLLDPGPASASVRVTEDAIVWSMGLDDLRKYLSEHVGGGGALLLGMAQCISQRLRHANQLVIRTHAAPSETVIPRRERAITAADAPVQLGFFDRLKKSFSGAAEEKKVQISTKIKL